MKTLQAIPLPQKMDLYAPDGSEIRLLAATGRASMVHCLLPPGAVSSPVCHRTVDELWYFLSGRGQVWRKFGSEEMVASVQPGMSLNIPLGTHFQFRAAGPEPLVFIIVTLPPWPGADEAVPVAGHWPSE